MESILNILKAATRSLDETKAKLDTIPHDQADHIKQITAVVESHQRVKKDLDQKMINFLTSLVEMSMMVWNKDECRYRPSRAYTHYYLFKKDSTTITFVQFERGPIIGSYSDYGLYHKDIGTWRFWDICESVINEIKSGIEHNTKTLSENSAKLEKMVAELTSLFAKSAI